MNPVRTCRALALAVLALLPTLAFGQTTAGLGTVLVVPLIAATSSYTSEIYVRNPQAAAITVNVRFYEAKTSTVPGLRSCNSLAVPAGLSVQFSLASQCVLGAGSHFGMLILEDAATFKTNYFSSFTRTQTPGGNGFSVEAFPIGNFSAAAAGVTGLKRQAAAPTFQSNCFVGALGEAVNYTLTLINGSTGATIGSPITGTLQPFEIDRKLDVFAAAGAPAGDYSNVRASFQETSAGAPALIGFCTVQESTFFGADFRVAKSADADDRRQKRFVCYAQSPCGTAITDGSGASLGSAANKSVHYFYAEAPDYIKCDLVSTRLSDLEMRVRGPGDVFTSPVFVSPAGGTGTFDSGGNNKTSIYIWTGYRNGFSTPNGNDGETSRLFLDVSFREGGNATFPIFYGISCSSGNGISVPYFRASAADDF